MTLKDVLSLWGIVLEGPPVYQRKVSELLRGAKSGPAGIAANPVGRVILTHIARSPRRLTIRRSSAQCNAGTATEGREDDAHPKGKHYYLGLENDPRTLHNDRFDQSKSKGTGKGANAVVEFSPGIAACGRGGVVFESDTVLLHELVHALRKMQGLENSSPLDATAGSRYGDSEEWLAILVENVYQSAKGRTQLRGAHDMRTRLQSPEDTSAGFLDDLFNRSQMRRYFYCWRPVFGDLSSVPAQFNPFRAYTLDPLKYGKLPW